MNFRTILSTLIIVLFAAACKFDKVKNQTLLLSLIRSIIIGMTGWQRLPVTI